MREPWAVLLDMDGLLVDSEPLWSVAEAELMARLGGPWGPEVKAACMGHRVEEACRILVEIAGSDADPTDVARWLVGRMVELYDAELPWRPGAEELVRALAAEGVPMALVSASYRVLVDAAIAAMGQDWFDVTVAGDEVTHGKPHPEAYTVAAGRLGIPPARCVVLEDSMTGIAAGEAAGCRCVGVPQFAPLEETPTRPVVASLTLLTPASLAALLDEAAPDA